ncbi:hypothetical protein LZ30DRAFT_52357 [Colletotrichum cereale]|nr:hypothetical protein LZ30DRAFT_52357 [Colletotrichum cereale]
MPAYQCLWSPLYTAFTGPCERHTSALRVLHSAEAVPCHRALTCLKTRCSSMVQRLLDGRRELAGLSCSPAKLACRAMALAPGMPINKLTPFWNTLSNPQSSHEMKCGELSGGYPTRDSCSVEEEFRHAPMVTAMHCFVQRSSLDPPGQIGHVCWFE